MALIINIAGLALMAAVVVWFWLWPRRVVTAGDASNIDGVTGDRTIDIDVADGVYTPDVIALKRGEVVTLRFHRKDASPCSEHVIFHGLDIDEVLPIGAAKNIRVAPMTSGTFRFTCQMQMYQGELRVSDAE